MGESSRGRFALPQPRRYTCGWPVSSFDIRDGERTPSFGGSHGGCGPESSGALGLLDITRSPCPRPSVDGFGGGGPALGEEMMIVP